MSPKLVKKLSLLTIIATLSLLGIAHAGLVIRSWDGSTQRGGDLFGAGPGSLQYGHFAAALTARGHTILPGVSAITPANLVGVDVFFHGTSSRLVTPSEIAVLLDFVSNHGCLVIEANSDPGEQAAADAILSGLGLGPHYTGVTVGPSGPSTGTFENVVSKTTVGALGDLRGQSFGASIVAEMTAGLGIVVGRLGTTPCMVEFPGPGSILAVGDPFAFNIFQQPGETLYNPNNEKAYLNFIESCGKLPTPVQGTTWGTLKTLYR